MRKIPNERQELAKKILEYNRKRLYEMPRKFAVLEEALKPEVKDFLLKIIAYWLKKDCIAYGSHHMVYFLGTQKGTYAIRKRTTKGVTNRYINYLCALGLLKKIEQQIFYGYDTKERRYFRKNFISKININMLRYNFDPEKEPYNTFELIKYTSEVLECCCERAERLLSKNITPGNISYNQLALNGLEDIAKEVYLEDREYAENKKKREYSKLLEVTEFVIGQKGYATKEDIFTNLDFGDNEIKRVFAIFKNDFYSRYNYRRPTVEQKEQFNLTNDNWIITKKQP